MEFHEGVYDPVSKMFTGVYVVTYQDDHRLEIVNIQESEVEESRLFSGDRTLIHFDIQEVEVDKRYMTLTPTLVDGVIEVTMPYWLYKKNPGLCIKRLRGIKIPTLKSSQNKEWFLDLLEQQDIWFSIIQSCSTNEEREQYEWIRSTMRNDRKRKSEILLMRDSPLPPSNSL